VGLLRDIQDGATEDSVSLSTLLRKVKLLANRLGVREIAQWAEHELSGYDNIEELPPYRGPFEATVLGHAFGPFGRELDNVPIPTAALAPKYRKSHLFETFFMQGVAELESLAATKQTLRGPWPADTVAAMPMLTQGGLVHFDPSLRWVEVWRDIPYPIIVGVLDAIRNRLLDFSMQVAEEEPSAEREQRLTNPGVERVAQTFHTIIYAGATNVAIGSQNVTQTQEFPAPYDTDGLMKYLRQLGLGEKMIDELQDALRKDAAEGHDAHSSKGPGRRVLSWLKEVSVAGTSKVGAPVATALITQVLLHHFGL
jgi:hypothetical protein